MGLSVRSNADLRSSFSILFSQSAINRLLRALGPLCVKLMLALTDRLDARKIPY